MPRIFGHSDGTRFKQGVRHELCGIALTPDKRDTKAFHHDKVIADGIAQFLFCLASVAKADGDMIDQRLRRVLRKLIQRRRRQIDIRGMAVDTAVITADPALITDVSLIFETPLKLPE